MVVGGLAHLAEAGQVTALQRFAGFGLAVNVGGHCHGPVMAPAPYQRIICAVSGTVQDALARNGFTPDDRVIVRQIVEPQR